MLHRPILGTLLCALCLIVPANATGGGTNQNLQCPCETSSNSVSVTGPNKNTSFSCDTSIQPFIDRAGMVIVVTDRNGKRSVRGGCGMKTLKWHAQDFGDTLCQANASQMNSYLAQMDHNDALICTENGPKIIKAAGNGLACNRDAIKEERIPLFAGERMRIYYHHAWSPTGDGAGAGGTVASGNCSGECLDLKDNNNNGVADVVDMRSGKNLNGNYNFYYPTFSGNFRVHSSNLPWVQTNGYVEQQNMNLYAPNKGLFTGADTHGLELDKARHEYAILLNNTDGTDALGVKIRAAARPQTPCGDQVQSFEVHAEKSDGSRTELGKINMRPYASIPVFQTYTFPFNSGEVGYSKIILKERSSCRTSNFYGGSLISQVWTAKRDPACKDPKDPETKNPPKQCSDGIDNDG
ncbi:MAG: hypothetical protein KDD62_06685, partial [Bdellovibrionales bacterium]|nr:hypothetical protein [Bdellovibrionales bacterium]